MELLWLGLATVPALLRGGESPVVVLASALLVLVAFTLRLFFWPKDASDLSSGLALPLLAGLALAVAATWTSVHRATSAWEVGWWLALAALMRLTQEGLEPGPGLARLAAALVSTAALISAYGLFETLVSDDRLLGVAKFAYRGQVTGTFVNPSHMASYLVLALPFGVVFAFTARGHGARALSGLGSVLITAAIVLSRSRGGWLATAASVLVLALLAGASRSAGHVRAGIVLVAGAVGLTLMTSPEALPALKARAATLIPGAAPGQDAFGRAGPWGAAWQLTRDRPLTGWGPGTYAQAFLAVRPPGYYFRPSHAHAELLELGVELGAGGPLLALALLAALCRLALAALARAPDERERVRAAALIAGGAGFLCTCVWDWPLHVPSTALAAAVLAGALAALTRPRETTTPASLRVTPVAVLALVAALAAAFPLTGRLHAELLLTRARQSAREGDTATALARYRAVRETWPSLWLAALEEVELLQSRATSDPGQAAQAALAAVRAHPGLPDSWQKLGGALIGAGLYDAAADAFGEAARLDPANHTPHLERGNTLWAVGRHEPALEAYRAALDAYPVEKIGQFPEIMTQMTPVSAALRTKEPRGLPPAVLAAAMRLLELRKARAPGDFRTYRLLEELYRNLGLHEEAAREAAAEAAAQPR